jgi:hypothetical protein
MSASSPYSGRLAELAVSFALILFLVSCAGPSWDGRYREAMDRVIPDMQRCSLRTPRYVVYSDAGQTRVVPVADLMEQAADAYDRLLDIDTSEEEKKSTIYVYGTWKRFALVAESLGFPPSVRAFYSPVAPAAVHVLLDETTFDNITPLLLHEGLHQRADLDCRVSGARTGNNSSPAERNPIGLPLWLNEGLATYMESARLVNGRLVTGIPNLPRLRELQNMIRNNYRFSAIGVLSRSYGEPFSSGDYAVAWGIVYDLAHTAGRHGMNDTFLDKYIATLKTDLAAALHELSANTPIGGSNDGGLFEAWNPILAEQSLKTFQKVVTGDGRSMSDWERDWRRRMLDVVP